MPFKKGNDLGKGRPVGAKNKATLEKERRREMFDELITQKWEEIIDELKPEYVADQFMGKAPDILDAKIKYIPFDELLENDNIQKDKSIKQED